MTAYNPNTTTIGEDLANARSSLSGMKPITPPDKPKSFGSMMSSPEAQAGMQLGGTTADMIGSGIQGALSLKANKEAEKEAIKLANIQRDDTLKQREKENKQAVREQRQAETAFDIEKQTQILKMRYDEWLEDFKRTVEKKQRSRSALGTLKSRVQQDDTFKNLLIELARN